MAATKTKTTSARKVDDYLSRVPEDSRVALEKLRRTIKSMVPDAVEGISYQIPIPPHSHPALAGWQRATIPSN